MRRTYGLLAVSLCAAMEAALLVYPLSIIQPFKHQEQGALERALWVFRIAPGTTLILALAAVGLAIWSWRGRGRVTRTALAGLVFVACGAAVAARINVFELMFHPAGSPAFVSVAKAKVDATDMLVTVALNGDARAYPIREMGYHHVVNDIVGGVPIVATY